MDIRLRWFIPSIKKHLCFRNRNRNQGGNGIGITGGGSENRRRFQPSGPGTGQRRPSQGRPLPPQDFNLPEGAVPLNRPNIN